MGKEVFVPLAIALVTGIVSSVATVTTIGTKVDWVKSDLTKSNEWIKSELGNHESRILVLERTDK